MSNYEVVKGPSPASYAGNPGFGMQLGQMLGQLPDSYMSGREAGKKIKLENAFADPKNWQDENGQPDANKIVKTLTEHGGPSYIAGLLPFLYDQKAGAQLASVMGGVGGGGGSGNPGYGSQPPVLRQPLSSPMTRGDATPNNPQGQQIRTSSNGAGIGDDNEAPTLRTTVAEFVGGDTDASPQISAAARALRINPDEPLTPDKAKLVKDFLGTRAAALGGQNGTAAAPFMTGGASGAPAPPAGRPGTPPQPDQPTTTPAQAQLGQQPTAEAATGATGMQLPRPPQQTAQPPGWRSTPVGTREQAQELTANAARIRTYAASLTNNNPGRQKAALEQADKMDAHANEILKSLGEYNKPTGEQINAGDPNIQRSKGLEIAQKAELDRGGKLYNGIQRLSGSYESELKPHLDLMRGIFNDPNFVSGTGEGFLTALNRIRSNPLFKNLPGYDPNAALPNEAIRKVMAAAILEQTTQMKEEAGESGAAGGRLFQQQIKLMSDAAQDPKSTLASLRYLTEVQTRMGEHARAVAKFADEYEGKYGKGVLDNNFNRALSKFNDEHPIFSKEEMANHALIAPPVAPAHASKAEARAWAEHAGLRPGDPIKTQSGKIIAFDPGMLK